MTFVWVALGVVGGLIVGGVVILLVFNAAIRFAIGRGLGW